MSYGSRIQQDAVDKKQNTQLQKPVAIRTIWGHRTISADTALLLARVLPIPLITKAINWRKHMRAKDQLNLLEAALTKHLDICFGRKHGDISQEMCQVLTGH
ncbi:hypothetical protein RUM43_014587, partial [Polyplax serrata]